MRVVDLRDRVVEVVERGRHDERRERLVRADLGGRRHVGQDRRREERAVGACRRRATLPPSATASSTQRCVRGGRVRVDHRAEVGRRVERIAHLAALRAPSAKRVHEVVPDVLVDERSRWTLMQTWPGVGERADEDAPDRPVEVRASGRR